MKGFSLLLTFFVLLGVSAIHASAQNSILDLIQNPVEKWVHTLFNNLRDVMRKGLSFLQLPPMDPLYLGGLKLPKELMEKLPGILEVSGDISNVTVEGMSSFDLSQFKFALFPPGFLTNLTIPQIRIKGYQNLKGKIASIVPLNQEGPFSVSVEKILVGVDAELGILSGWKFYLEDLKLRLSLNRINVKIGDGFIAGLTTGVMSNAVTSFFNSNIPPKMGNFSVMVKHLVNEYLLRDKQQ